jgi:hypothetical protein
MKICFYCTSGRDFKNYDYKIIEEFNFKDYVVKVFEINNLNELFEFGNKINSELVLANSRNVISHNKEEEVYTVDFINNFLDNYPYAIEIYDYYRE